METSIGRLRRCRGRRFVVGVNELDLFVHADRVKDAARDRIEECLRNLPVIPITNQSGIDGLDADPHQTRFDPLAELVLNVPDQIFHGRFVDVHPLGTVHLQPVPVPLSKPVSGPLGDLSEPALGVIEGAANRPTNFIGPLTGSGVLRHRCRCSPPWLLVDRRVPFRTLGRSVSPHDSSKKKRWLHRSPSGPES